MTDGISGKLNINTQLNTGEIKQAMKEEAEDLLFSPSQNLSEKSQDIEISVNDENLDILRKQLEDVNDEQGLIGKLCDGAKCLTGLGRNSEKCEEFIEQYKQGKISFEEVQKKIEKFKTSQKDDVNFFTNTATYVAGFVAGAVVIGTGGAALGVFAAGVAAGTVTGAVTKAGLKTIDRATNNIDGDALDRNQINRDVLSGAVGGGATVATGGIGKAVGFAGSLIRGGADGAITGAADYIADVAFDDNAEFNASDFAKTTAIGTVSFGAAGGIRSKLAQSAIGKTGGKIIDKLIDNVKWINQKAPQFLKNIFGKKSQVGAENATAGEFGLYMSD